MKNKHILILFLIAMVVVFAGAYFKIQHYEGANILLGIGLLAQAICMVLLVIKLMKGKSDSGFLDS